MGGVGFPMLGDRLLDGIGSDAGVHSSFRDWEGKRNTSMRRESSYTEWLSKVPHRHIGNFTVG